MNERRATGGRRRPGALGDVVCFCCLNVLLENVSLSGILKLNDGVCLGNCERSNYIWIVFSKYL